MAYIGTNMSVAVQSTLGVALTVSAVTLANSSDSPPSSASSTSHGLSNGDYVVFTVTDGMVQLDGQAVRVYNVTTNAFELEGLDTSSYSAWTTGTCKKVTAFSTLSSAQNVTMPNAAPAKIDITRLIDVVKQYVYGLPDAPQGSIVGLFNPGGAAEALIIAATNNNSRIAIKLNWAGGPHTIFNAFVSGGAGFDLQTNAAAHATFEFTPIAKVLHYAT